MCIHRTFIRTYGRIFFMKNYYPFIVLFIISCSPSPEQIAEAEKRKNEAIAIEKERINNVATSACNEAINSDEINSQKIFQKLTYTMVDIGTYKYDSKENEKFIDSFKYGLCKELVLGDPEFDEKLQNAKDQEIAAAKLEIRKRNTEIAKSLLKEIPVQPKLTSINFDYEAETFEIEFDCSTTQGMRLYTVVVFKHDLGRHERQELATCYKARKSTRFWSLTDEQMDLIFYEGNPQDYIQEIYLYWKGSFDRDEYMQKLRWEGYFLNGEYITKRREKYSPKDLRYIRKKLDLYYEQNVNLEELKTKYIIYP